MPDATKKAEREKARKATVDAEVKRLKDSGVKFGPANDFVAQLLDQSDELAKSKAALFERIGKNRAVLKDVLGTGLLSEEQARSILNRYVPGQGAPSKSGESA